MPKTHVNIEPIRQAREVYVELREKVTGNITVGEASTLARYRVFLATAMGDHLCLVHSTAMVVDLLRTAVDDINLNADAGTRVTVKHEGINFTGTLTEALREKVLPRDIAPGDPARGFITLTNDQLEWLNEIKAPALAWLERFDYREAADALKLLATDYLDNRAGDRAALLEILLQFVRRIDRERMDGQPLHKCPTYQPLGYLVASLSNSLK